MASTRAEIEDLPVQWRIVFANGRYGGPGPYAEMRDEFDRVVRQLEEWGIDSKAMGMRLEGRKTFQDGTYGDWLIYGDVIRELLGPRHADPGPVANAPFSPIQIDRIKSRQFGWGDPCVICGVEFRKCFHTTLDTEAFINQFKEWSRFQR